MDMREFKLTIAAIFHFFKVLFSFMSTWNNFCFQRNSWVDTQKQLLNDHENVQMHTSTKILGTYIEGTLKQETTLDQPKKYTDRYARRTEKYHQIYVSTITFYFGSYSGLMSI